MSNPTIWKKKRRGVEFSAHADEAVYVAFDWNGTGVWEYCTTWKRKKDSASFVKFLRDVADKIESSGE